MHNTFLHLRYALPEKIPIITIMMVLRLENSHWVEYEVLHKYSLMS